MPPKLLHVALALAAGLAVSTLDPARAAACTPCTQPDYGFAIDRGGTIPRNVRGLVWIGKDMPTQRDFEVVRVDDGKEVPVRFTVRKLKRLSRSYPAGVAVLVRPAKAMKVGERYRFRATRFASNRPLQDGDETHEREVVVSADALALAGKPRLMSLRLVGAVQVAMGRECAGEIQAAQARVEIVLPDEWERFRPLLMFTTLVDGKPGWSPRAGGCYDALPGRSWQGLGQDLVYSRCGGDDSHRGVAPGKHRIAMQISLPGTGAGDGVTITSHTVEVELRCPATP